MLQALVSLYRPELPFDQQTACVEEFFTPANFEDAGVEDDGSDASSSALINHALESGDASPEIESMLQSWLTDGF